MGSWRENGQDHGGIMGVIIGVIMCEIMCEIVCEIVCDIMCIDGIASSSVYCTVAVRLSRPTRNEGKQETALVSWRPCYVR